MDYDLRNSSEGLHIPVTVYKKFKRCPTCQSVYITDVDCEACGRSLLYHPIGEAFGPKSYYGIKERYLENLNGLIRFFPLFENKKSLLAKSYVRHLSKRFSDLISAFNSSGLIDSAEGEFFYVECVEIIDELLRYRLGPDLIQRLLEDNDSSQIGQKLRLYLQNARLKIHAEESWRTQFLNYRIGGVFRLESFLKVIIVFIVIVSVAIAYKDFINSQFGK
jgi:hypothetical protein